MDKRFANRLILTYGPSANGSFSNLDQFGQVTKPNWQVNSSTVDEYQYAYDYNGNREYRKNSDASGIDEAYTYDDLNRVTDLQRGTLSGTTNHRLRGGIEQPDRSHRRKE